MLCPQSLIIIIRGLLKTQNFLIIITTYLDNYQVLIISRLIKNLLLQLSR